MTRILNAGDIEMMLRKFVCKYQLGKAHRREQREFFRSPIWCLKCARSSETEDLSRNIPIPWDRKIPAPCQDQGSELVGNYFLRIKSLLKYFAFSTSGQNPHQTFLNLECEDLPITQGKVATVDLPVPASNSSFPHPHAGPPTTAGLDFPCSNLKKNNK